ncbi:MAG: tetratricopeptide repeat protein, partial [Candidatus Omnitrophota bacterium]
MGRTTKILILAACFCGLILPGFCFEEMQDFKSPDFDDIEVTKQLETLEIYFETALYEEAAGLLVELIVRFPQEPRFYYLQAIVDYQRGRYQQAQEIFRKFTEEYPDIPEPYYLLAEISLKRGESDQARQYLK